MDTFTRYSRKIRMTLLKAVTLICFICLIYIPKEKDSEVIEGDTGYYTVELNGQVLGAMNSAEEAETALAVARGRVSAEAGTLVYLDPELNIVPEKTTFGTRYSVDEMADEMYEILAKSTLDFDKIDAYTVRINDYTVTLASKEDIMALVEGVKANYDEDNEFLVRITGNADLDSSEFGLEIVKAEIGDTGASKVLSFENGEAVVQADADTIFADGTLAMTFDKTISVVPTEVSVERLVSVEEAIADITKETESKTIYTVQSGDTLSQIAVRYGLSIKALCDLNDGLTENGVIGIGDEIVVTVPTPELSVRVFEETTYEENYKAEVQYIDDDTMYQGDYAVVQEGSEGFREVVAVVQYENGSERSRDIIKETLIVESVPRILKRGTQVPPTYRKPIAGGVLTSPYGARWGTIHRGVDWGVPTGTAVMASSGGVVVRSGWFAGYGICVDIRHPDGKLTRYGHLSKTLVSVGQTVTQGQVVARSGNTGDSTGPHLHFEIQVGGTAVNPFTYLK